MKLIEYKDDFLHYFTDEQGRKQGKYKAWRTNGQLWTMRYYKDNYIHGERKFWALSGKLLAHTYICDDVIIDFLENPELYPETDEEKTMFVLKYGSAPLIK